MCGFVGAVMLNGSPVSRPVLERMRDSMPYRGPDDAGLYIDGPAGLGHRRLSIIDLTRAGHQPMTNEDGSLHLVFNGLISNYVELMAHLRSRGHRFRSETDTEVILHLYEEEGEDCVRHLNGMFSFAIWDARKRVLFAARDRAGIKPFNYYIGHDRFLFGSEIKGILADGAVPRLPDLEFFADFLYAGYSLGDRTAFKGIKQLLPGHSLTLKDGGFRIRKYWDVEYCYNYSRSDQQVEEEARALIEDAVRTHCRSDSTLGCHLSGGLDSSTVVAFAARQRTSMKTFSIRFNGKPYYDETAYAREVAAKSRTEYVEMTPSPTDLAHFMPSLLWHLEVPMPTVGGFAYYAVSQLAAQHVKVSLTGHGGDEIFAGYPAQFQAAFGTQRMFASTRDPDSIPESPLDRFKRVWRKQGVRGVVDRVNAHLHPAKPTLEDLWISLHCGLPTADNEMLSSSFISGLGGYSPREDFTRPLHEAKTDHVLDRVLYHDLRSYLPGLLHMEDRLSMSVSLESRVPLLDYRIIEFLATVPPHQKLINQQSKALLRSAARHLLPSRVSERRSKVGFPVPVRSWLKQDLAHVVKDIVFSPACQDRGIFDPAVLKSPRFSSSDMWSVLNIELWFRIFIDRDPAWCNQLGAASAARSSAITARPLPDSPPPLSASFG